MGIHSIRLRGWEPPFYRLQHRTSVGLVPPLFMPFKLRYHAEHIVIEFTNIVVALRLIVALVLWVWLYAIALLLSHYNGPIYFDRN